MRIDVKTLPVNEILTDIAESLETELIDNSGNPFKNWGRLYQRG